ncbi:hypothetical protein [Streptomyces vinaceus]
MFHKVTVQGEVVSCRPQDLQKATADALSRTLESGAADAARLGDLPQDPS